MFYGFLFSSYGDIIKQTLVRFLMVYLILAVLSSVGVSVTMRLSTKKAAGSLVMLSCNYLVCLLISLLFAGFEGLFSFHSGNVGALWMGSINGAFYLASFVLYQRSVKHSGMVLSSTFMKLGLLVPIVISVFFLLELPSLIQVVGFAIALAGIVLMQLGGKDHGGRFSPALLLVLVLGGGANAMSEVYESVGDPAYNSQFLLYTFFAAFLLCCILTLLRQEKPTRHSIFYGLLIGIPNYFSARFLLLSLHHVPAMIAHPTYSALSVGIVSILGLCIFKEHLAKRQWIAMGIILISLIFLNI